MFTVYIHNEQKTRKELYNLERKTSTFISVIMQQNMLICQEMTKRNILTKKFNNDVEDLYIKLQNNLDDDIQQLRYDATTFEPPYPDAVGVWVLRNEFEGKKSFGYYECYKCSRKNIQFWWISAHAHKKFRQICKKCNCKLYPLYLWENPLYMWKNMLPRKHNNSGKNDAPHMSQLCEACKAGCCLRKIYHNNTSAYIVV